MELFEAIHHRRSMRKFTDRVVSSADIETLLKAAMTAPSAGNGQPWRFVVVRDKAMLDKFSQIHPYARMCRTAQAAIVLCGEPGVSKYPQFWQQDCGAAAQNLLLAVHGLGLGAVWCGLYPNEEVYPAFINILNLPEGVLPMSLIPVGYPALQSGPKDRFKPEYIHGETW